MKSQGLLLYKMRYYIGTLLIQNEGPEGLAVISLQKVDSLLVFLNVTGAKKVSARWHLRDLSIDLQCSITSS